MGRQGSEGRAGLRLAGLAAAWLAGVALQMQQPSLWPAAAYAAGLAIGVGTAALAWRRAWPAVLLAVACAAFMQTGWRAQARLADALDLGLEGQDLVLVGVVAQLPRTAPEGTRFVFDVEQAERAGRPVTVPPRIALGWYRGGGDDDVPGAPDAQGPRSELRAGQRWRFTARLRAPHGNLNPHGFDYELWLFEQGIGATGTVRAGPGRPAERLHDAAAHPVERLRQRIRDAIDAQVPDRRAAGVLAALAVGDQAAIDRDDWDLFRATGIAHLVSISGVHVTMFAWLAAALVGRLWRRSPRLMRACPAPRAARWGGLAAAAGYALLAGWGVPAQRTVWMLATAAVLSSRGLRWPWLLVLAAAAVVVTAIDPWALLQPGFWLSFVAVGLLMASEPGRERDQVPATLRGRGRHVLASGLRTQVLATLGLTPLGLVFFQQVSIVGFVANLVAIPLVTLVITPLALLGVLASPAWDLAAAAVEALSRGLAVLAAWPAAVWQVPVAAAWMQAAGLLGGLLIVAPLAWRLRLLGLPLVVPLLLPPVAVPAEGRFEAVAADVGQGSAVLVRTRAHLLVYDAGPQYAPGRNAGERVLLPLLRARGERRIDLLMLSHRDTDHVGGAAALIAGLPVDAISSSLEPGHPLLAAGVPHRRCDAGEHWQWDGVTFDVLYPSPADHARGGTPNALSCVLRIADVTGASLLLAGDLEAPQEAALVERDATSLKAGTHESALKADVLLVPHHGSRTSSSDAFLDAVAPSTAVVQAGYRNRFGHPAAAVMDRYAARGIAVARTDTCGAWTWRDDGAMSCERLTGRRYWHPRAAAEPVADGVEVASRALPLTRPFKEPPLWPSTSR